MLRGLMLVLLLTGCSSKDAATMDMSAAPPDMSWPCLFAWSGDNESGSARCLAQMCLLPSSDTMIRSYSTAGRVEVAFTLGGPFTPGRSYAAADLKSFSAMGDFAVGPPGNDVFVAGSQVGGSTVTLTVADVDPGAPQNCPLGDGAAHGSAQLGLVELINDDGGARAPRHVTLDVTF
jgi:hypothetical protein